MAAVQKHYRMSEKAIEIIEKRDFSKFPSESGFINEAVLEYFRQDQMKKWMEHIDKRLSEIQDCLEEKGQKNEFY